MTAPPGWPFDPDWTNGIIETLEWKTVILASVQGAEQRYAIRISPRRFIEIDYVLTDLDRIYFDNFMMAYGGAPMYVGLPWDEQSVGAVTSGQNTFTLFAPFTEFQVGGQVVIRERKQPERWDVNTISAMTETSITTEGTSQPYVDAMIAPAFLMQIPEQAKATRKTDTVYTVTLRFQSAQDTIWPIPGHAVVTPRTYSSDGVNSYPLLFVEPNSVEDLDYTYERTYLTVDNEMSVPVWNDLPARGYTSQAYSFFVYNTQQISAFRDLLFSLKGSVVPIWVPTFNDDMPVGQGVPNPPTHTLPTMPGRELAITFHTDGSYAVINVTGSNFPTDYLFNSSTVRTSFLALKRLEQDSIEIKHETNQLITVKVTMRDAPDLRTAPTYSAQPYADANYYNSDGTLNAAAANSTSVLNQPLTVSY